MENKYYIPTIEEFHIGFRYEHYEDWDIPNKEKEWHKQIYGEGCIVGDYDIKYGIIRVKCLDEADIIEAGWNIDKECCTDYVLGDYTMDTYNWVHKPFEIVIKDFNVILFCGHIKNYNELLKVMEMLGIKKEE